jgi:hypothetical protein
VSIQENNWRLGNILTGVTKRFLQTFTEVVAHDGGIERVPEDALWATLKILSVGESAIFHELKRRGYDTIEKLEAGLKQQEEQ